MTDLKEATAITHVPNPALGYSTPLKGRLSQVTRLLFFKILFHFSPPSILMGKSGKVKAQSRETTREYYLRQISNPLLSLCGRQEKMLYVFPPSLPASELDGT